MSLTLHSRVALPAVLACIATLTVMAAPASAQLLVMVDDACGGTTWMNCWDCASADQAMVVSLDAAVMLPSGLSGTFQGVIGNETEMEIVFDRGSVPSWWQFGGGRCRSADSYRLTWDGDSPACTGGSYFRDVGGYQGLSAYYCGPVNDPRYGPVGADRVRFNTIAWVPQDQALAHRPQPAWGDAVYLHTLAIDGRRSFGVDACEGCSESAYAVLRRVKLVQPAGMGDFSFDSSDPAPPGTIRIPTLGAYLQDRPYPCMRGTRAARTTWGRIKALYR